MYQLAEFSVYAHELGILELGVHQVPKVLIHVHQHQIPQAHG
jgi:hypothetical protein